ncbi:MAG: reductase, partial [Devosia sp.]|nr:reductase [Devosia sp.]
HPLGGQNKSFSDIEGSIGPSAKDMLDQLIWWGTATKAARTQDNAQAAVAAE